MNKDTVNNFIKTTELYLKLTEQRRSQINFDEFLPLIYFENKVTNTTNKLVSGNSSVQTNSVIM